MRKKLVRAALALALALSLLLTAALAEEVISDPFDLKGRVTARPEASQAPEEAAPEAEQPTIPERSVSLIASTPSSELEMGDEVLLTAILQGYDGAQVQIDWERLVDGAWQPIGQSGRTLLIKVDEQTAQSSWRFTVTVLEEAVPQAQPEPVAQDAVEQAAQ